MPPRFLILLPLALLLLAGNVSCQRQEPDALRRRLATLEAELAQALGQADDRQHQITGLRAQLARIEAELEEANRRLVRVKVDNAKLRQELNAQRKKNGQRGTDPVTRYTTEPIQPPPR
jgi:septal ring factor EnvC (AmiA/AmiB activator)